MSGLSGWGERNNNWLSEFRPRNFRARRAREARPLILCGRGVSLRVDRGALTIKNGLTHYPQEREEFRFFKGDLAMPPRILILDGSGTLSFEVISWLSEQAVPLVQLDFRGHAVSVIGGNGFAPEPERVRWQLETRANPELRLAFCRDLIESKLRVSRRTLSEALPDSPTRTAALNHIEGAIHQLRTGAPKSVDEVRVVEARAAAAYFAAWRNFPL